MIDTWLFDWGDTLMVDFPGVRGKMCDWDVVEIVPGAEEVLRCLSAKATVCIATNAAESTESDIIRAFKRVGLSDYIHRYFCRQNLGLAKGTVEYYSAILSLLDQPPEHVAMVGDSLENDIVPAASLGIKTYWLAGKKETAPPESTIIIRDLNELLPRESTVRPSARPKIRASNDPGGRIDGATSGSN